MQGTGNICVSCLRTCLSKIIKINSLIKHLLGVCSVPDTAFFRRGKDEEYTPVGRIPNLAVEPLKIKKLHDLFEQDEFLRIECSGISKCDHQALWRSRLGE